METKNLCAGILVGSIAGVAIGLLFAPQSGKETREQIGEKLDELQDKVIELTSKIKDKLA